MKASPVPDYHCMNIGIYFFTELLYAQVTESDMQEAAKMSLLSDAEKEVHTTAEQLAQSRTKHKTNLS
jgi:hypothetical protein